MQQFPNHYQSFTLLSIYLPLVFNALWPYYKGKVFSDFPMKFCSQIIVNDEIFSNSIVGHKIVKDIDIKNAEKIKEK